MNKTVVVDPRSAREINKFPHMPTPQVTQLLFCLRLPRKRKKHQ